MALLMAAGPCQTGGMWKYDLGGLVVLLFLAIAYVLRGEGVTLPGYQAIPLRWRIGIASGIFLVATVIVLLVRFG
jgi:hypothetical protein